MGDAGFPATAAGRDRFVLERRGPRPQHDPWAHQGLIVEDERTAEGVSARVATIFLTGRECPWRCTMCDLWRHTLEGDTPAGSIPAQIAAALSAVVDRADAVTVVKLYNAGSFFDPRAVPESDYDAVAAALDGVARVIVESHPALVGTRVDRFLAALRRRAGTADTRLEVAMGLETVHPVALDYLNKRLSLGDFEAAARALAERDVALRVFLLISPPFVPSSEQDAWLLRSVDAAFACGATAVSLVPTRSGNGAMEALAAAASFRAPSLADIERSHDLALSRAAGRGRIFADLWDLDRFAACPRCFDSRLERLMAMNREQRVRPHAPCPAGADHAA
jgi:radical SAM enzyme (TIGR01210 family)